MPIKTELLTFGHSNSNELTNHFNPSRPDPGRKEKINLHVYFTLFLWRPQKVQAFIDPFWGTRKKCEYKNFT